MWTPSTEEIENQRKKVFENKKFIQLDRPCKINDGILKLSNNELEFYVKKFKQSESEISFFVPASGSGSRMFQFLFDYKEKIDEETEGNVIHFIQNINQFSLFHLLPEDLQHQINHQQFDIHKIIRFLLDEKQLNIAQKPKALVPFHQLGPFMLNPFQEHLLQGKNIGNNKINFVFTIQKKFEKEFKEILMTSEKMIEYSFQVSFEEQDEKTNSIAFDEMQNTIQTNQGLLTRPAGHGALLTLLNKIDADVIFIKNIDNVQHYNQHQISNKIINSMGGLLLQLKEEMLHVYENADKNLLIELNNKYHLFDHKMIAELNDKNSIQSLLLRPIRVCGMVKNEGLPGGGPFWIEKDGRISKQIVESSEISHQIEQRNILLQSTHFNPVMIAASSKNILNEKLDLNEYCDESAFFTVHKDEKGQSINYIEKPGLWNGGMANWLSVFVEIPKEVFTPVKTVLDLLHQGHCE